MNILSFSSLANTIYNINIWFLCTHPISDQYKCYCDQRFKHNAYSNASNTIFNEHNSSLQFHKDQLLFWWDFIASYSIFHCSNKYALLALICFFHILIEPNSIRWFFYSIEYSYDWSQTNQSSGYLHNVHKTAIMNVDRYARGKPFCSFVSI